MKKYIYQKRAGRMSEAACPFCAKKVAWANMWASFCGHIENTYCKEHPAIMAEDDYTRVWVFQG